MQNKGNRDITLNIKNFVVLDFIGNMGVSVYKVYSIQYTKIVYSAQNWNYQHFGLCD